MFRLDLAAIQEAAIEARLMANPANAANPIEKPVEEHHPLATLAISQQRKTQIDPAVTDLLSAAMRVCDTWGDAPDAREQMCRDCLGTPLHLRADLLDYLKSRSSATAAQTLRGQRY